MSRLPSPCPGLFLLALHASAWKPSNGRMLMELTKTDDWAQDLGQWYCGLSLPLAMRQVIESPPSRCLVVARYRKGNDLLLELVFPVLPQMDSVMALQIAFAMESVRKLVDGDPDCLADRYAAAAAMCGLCLGSTGEEQQKLSEQFTQLCLAVEEGVGNDTLTPAVLPRWPSGVATFIRGHFPSLGIVPKSS